jgi:hypothetical protein
LDILILYGSSCGISPSYVGSTAESLDFDREMAKCRARARQRTLLRCHREWPQERSQYESLGLLYQIPKAGRWHAGRGEGYTLSRGHAKSLQVVKRGSLKGQGVAANPATLPSLLPPPLPVLYTQKRRYFAPGLFDSNESLVLRHYLSMTGYYTVSKSESSTSGLRRGNI